MKLALGGAAVLLLGALALLLFSELWVRIGLGAALLVVVGGALLFARRADQKAKASRAGLERI
jgi:hypothetical protein